jgi:hypothetical protein
MSVDKRTRFRFRFRNILFTVLEGFLAFDRCFCLTAASNRLIAGLLKPIRSRSLDCTYSK